MKPLFIVLFSIFAHYASAQIYTELPPQYKGDTMVWANRYDLSGLLVGCDSCLLDFRTMRKNVTECAATVTSTSSPVQLTSDCFDNLVDQGSTQSSCTFKLPDEPTNGQICRLVFNNAVTTLVIEDSGATTLLTSTATSSSVFTYKYYLAASTWKRIQ